MVVFVFALSVLHLQPCICGAVGLAGLAGVKTFGGSSLSEKGVAARIFPTNETELWSHSVSPSCASSPTCAALMTFLWTVGGKECHGRFIYDNVIIRYYLDGATTAQLEFFQGAAAGSFVHLESKDYYTSSYDPKTGHQGVPCEQHGTSNPYCGMDLADSDTNDGTFQPWMTKWAGKNGAEGNWVNHFRIPFYESVRVTAQINPDRPEEIPANTTIGLFAMFRGLEGDETTLAATTQLGGVPLPPLKSYKVYLRLLKNDMYRSDHLEYVSLANISRWTLGTNITQSGPKAVLNATGGALFLVTVGFRPGYHSRGLDWDGGCWWALIDGNASLQPGKALLVGEWR